MIRLVEPCEKYLKSYIDAYDEYSAHGVTTYCFDDARAYDIFEKYDNYRNERNLKPNRVGADYYWLVDDERDYFIGEISIRHRLTEALEQYGGHIGYGVRYSEWNKGYGTLMLKFALEKAQERGLSWVLITCDDDNPGSARVMERNGLVLRDKVRNIIDGQEIITRRYDWFAPMEITEYTKERISDVLQFEQDLRAEEQFWGWEIDEKYIADVTKSFENPAFDNSVSLLAYLDGKVVGRIDSTMICSHFDGSTKAYLDWICVIKSYRHRGVAQRLMETLRKELKSRGVDTLIALIAANDEAQRFYRSLENAEIRDEGIWIDL